MPFGFINASTTYQQVITKAFQNYLYKFMQVFCDDFYVYSKIVTYLDKLTLYLEKCREYNINLNPEKCLFLMFLGLILGYVVSKDGKFPDPKKLRLFNV